MSEIDELMKELSDNNFKRTNHNLPANFVNEVLSICGCDENLVVDSTTPGDSESSNLFRVLMYQNLLLLERIESLEERNKLFPKINPFVDHSAARTAARNNWLSSGAAEETNFYDYYIEILETELNEQIKCGLESLSALEIITENAYLKIGDSIADGAVEYVKRLEEELKNLK